MSKLRGLTKVFAVLAMLAVLVGGAFLMNTSRASAHSATQLQRTSSCNPVYSLIDSGSYVGGYRWMSFEADEYLTQAIEGTTDASIAVTAIGFLASYLGVPNAEKAGSLTALALQSWSAYISYLDNRCGSPGVNVGVNFYVIFDGNGNPVYVYPYSRC